MLSFLNASGRPASQLDYDRMKPYSGFGETSLAAMRSQARIGTPGFWKTEMALSSQIDEEMANDPEAAEAWENRGFLARVGQGAALAATAAPPFVVAGVMANTRLRESYLPKYASREELRSAMAERGFDFSDDIPMPTGGMTIARAIVFQQNYEKEMADRAIMENARPGLSGVAAKVGGGIVGALADPVNYLPIANGLNRARMLGQGTGLLSRGGLATLGRSAAIGAAEGAGGALVADMAAFPYANQWGAGLGWEDLAADMAISGLLGGALSVFGTAIGPRKAGRLHQDAMVKAAADDVAGRPVDIASIVEARVQRELRSMDEVRGRMPEKYRSGFKAESEADLRARLTRVYEAEAKNNPNSPLLRSPDDPAMPPRSAAGEGEPRPISFEKAGPERSELEAQAMEQTFDELLSDGDSPAPPRLLDEAETKLAETQVNELVQRGEISETQLAELNEASINLERVQQERSALLEAAECVMRSGV